MCEMRKAVSFVAGPGVDGDSGLPARTTETAHVQEGLHDVQSE